MTKTLEQTLRGIVILGSFLLPFICLAVTTSLYFPYITGKNFAFRIIVEIMSGAWLALALVYPRYRPRRSWILAAFSLFVLIIAIADAQGAGPFKSFWSNYERMDGWVTLAHLLAYLAIVVSVINTEKLWRWLFRVSLGVSVFVSLYGFLQIAGDIAIGQGGAGGLSARIDATFGNPIYLAVYMLFHVFLAALLWAHSWRESNPSKRLPASLLYGFVIVLDTLTLLFTGTRGATLGLIGGTLLGLVLYAFSSGASRKVRQATIGALALAVVFAGTLFLARESSFVRNIGFLDRLASLSVNDGTIKARFLNMGIAWEGVKERPILGWGQENYAIVFDKYYDPRMYGQEPWFDRVHNIVFDWWIAGGTLGLLAYLFIFVALLWTLWRRSAGKDAFTNAERAILTGLLAGYFVHNLTVFDNVTSYILFITVAGFIAWRRSDAEQTRPIVEVQVLPEASLPLVGVVAALLVWGCAWWVNASPLAANRALIEAIRPQSSGGPLTNLKYFDEAISRGGFGVQEAREQLAQIASQLAPNQSVDIATKQKFFDMAVREMQIQETRSPLDARFPLFLGIVFAAYGDAPDAATALARARDLSPKKQSILFAIAQNQQAVGNSQGALETLKAAYELNTDVTDAQLMYASALIMAGHDARAEELLAPLIVTGVAADPRIAAAYATRGRYDKIAMLWEAKIAANPNDLQLYLTLAAAYYEAGNAGKAITVLQNAEAAIPSAKDQVEELIGKVRDGTIKVN